MINVAEPDGGDDPADGEVAQSKSPYELTHGVKFTGKLIPFGAKVQFKPSNVREEDKPTKWGSDSKVGVFEGTSYNPVMFGAASTTFGRSTASCMSA